MPDHADTVSKLRRGDLSPLAALRFRAPDKETSQKDVFEKLPSRPTELAQNPCKPSTAEKVPTASASGTGHPPLIYKSV